MISKKPPITLRFSLLNSKMDLERKLGREVSWVEIADTIGIHVNTLYNVSRNKTRRLDLDILAALLLYFRGQGVDVGFDTFLVWTGDKECPASP